MTESVWQRAAAQAQTEIVKPLRETLVGRHFASINPYLKGDGRNVLEVTHLSDLSGGFVQYNIPNGSEHADALTATTELIKIPYLYKHFKQDKNSILAWDLRKVSPGEENSLQSIGAQTAARKVAEQEEQIIFNGWKPNGTTYAIKGFTEIAGNIVAGGSISTVGTMFNYVATAISSIEDNAVFGEQESYNLAITPAIKAALLSKRYMNGDREMAEIKGLLNNGNIYTSPYLPAGTAVVTPVDTARNHFEFLNPVDYSVEFKAPEFERLSDPEAIVYELFAPHFMRVESGVCYAVSKITNLAP